MISVQKKAQSQLQDLLISALNRAMENGELVKTSIPDFLIETPAGSAHGDFATNIAMVGARIFKQSPMSVAQKIVNNLSLDGTYFQKCEVARPGFINFFLGKTWFKHVIVSILSEKENYGRSDFGAGKKVLIEFVSANPTGPMHIGNARGGAVGDCLAELLTWAGYDVTREFYVNDAGNQIEKFKKSLSTRYMQLYSKDGRILFPQDCYQGEDIIEIAKSFAKIHKNKYVNVSENERAQALVEYALPINVNALKTDLLKYRIDYDSWFLESSLHKNGKVLKTVDMLKNKGYVYEKDGALWLNLTKFGKEKDEVLVRENKIPTYFAADIAYHYDKLVDRKFQKAINIWGADHHGHVERLKSALEILGVDPKRLNIILMQMVRLVRDGQTVKISKRSGKSITLTSLLDEIPVDAARFFFNMREVNSHFDFDLDLAVEQSSKNPVYYVQYAHARICKMLKNLEKIGKNPSIDSNYFLLAEQEETELVKSIAKFPDEIVASVVSSNPSRLTKFLIDVATLFHRFYGKCKVFGSEEELLGARLGLCLAVKITLKNALSILKISAPEEM